MAVSNSIDFTQTAQELIVDALAELGVLAEEEPLEATDLNRGLRILTRMLKAWQVDGVMTWTMTSGTLTLVQGQEDYAFGAGGDFVTVPLDIGDMEINRGTNDLPMFRLSREEYRNLPNKTTQGYPTQFYYDRQRTGGTLYVWPAPDATAGTLKFTYRRIIMDMDAGANNIDLPQEWHDAIVFGLAKGFIGPYSMDGKPAAARIMKEAERTYQIVKGFDIGEGKGSLSVTPGC
jgi:hypothetical protein